MIKISLENWLFSINFHEIFRWFLPSAPKILPLEDNTRFYDNFFGFWWGGDVPPVPPPYATVFINCAYNNYVWANVAEGIVAGGIAVGEMTWSQKDEEHIAPFRKFWANKNTVALTFSMCVELWPFQYGDGYSIMHKGTSFII